MRKLDVPPGNDALSELAATLHLAHDRLAEIVEQHPELDGTSTTVSAAVFDGTHLQVAHVGDSRAYLLRDGVAASRSPPTTPWCRAWSTRAGSPRTRPGCTRTAT